MANSDNSMNLLKAHLNQYGLENILHNLIILIDENLDGDEPYRECLLADLRMTLIHYQDRNQENENA